MSGADVQSEQPVVHVAAGNGIGLWVPETLPGPFADGEGPLMSRYTILATAQITAGWLTSVNIVVPSGNGPSPHRHTGYDESFFVLDGSFIVTSGGQEFEISQGDFVFVPRGTVHSWYNSSGRTARMLLCTPSDGEQFFREAGRPIRPGEDAERLTREDARRAEEAARRQFGPLPAVGR